MQAGPCMSAVVLYHYTCKELYCKIKRFSLFFVCVCLFICIICVKVLQTFQNVVLEETLESPLGYKEIKPVNPKGNQPWIFIGRTDAKAEAPILWPPDVKSWLIGKDPDAGKYWGQEEKWVTEDEMVGWHHRLNEHEFEQTPRSSEGQGSLECWSPWARKESDTTEQLNWTECVRIWI